MRIVLKQTVRPRLVVPALAFYKDWFNGGAITDGKRDTNWSVSLVLFLERCTMRCKGLLGARNVFNFMLLSAIFLVTQAFASPSAITCPPLAQKPLLDGDISSDEWEDASGSIIQHIPFVTHPTITEAAGVFRVGTYGEKIYFLFEISNMEQLPVSSAQENGDIETLAKDDFVEIFVGPEGQTIYFTANANGVFSATSASGRSVLEAFEVGAKKFGPAQHIVESSVRRGMTIEVALDPTAAGLSLPISGEAWQLQIISKNPNLTWNPIPPQSENGDFRDELGVMRFGRPFTRLESVKVSNGNRLISADVSSETQVMAEVSPDSGNLVRKFLRPGGSEMTISAPGGESYTVNISSANFSYTFQEVSTPSVPVLVVPNPSFQSFFIEVDPHRPDREIDGEIILRFIQNREEKWSQVVDLDSLETRLHIRVPYTEWELGPCVMVVEKANREGSINQLAEFELSIPEQPVWASFRLPEDAPLIPKPFTPVLADEKEVEVWGRKFGLGKTPFLDQISAKETNILEKPVELHAKVDGHPVEWVMENWQLVSVSEEAVLYEAEADSIRGLRLNVKTRIEYDGMVRFDWSLIPTKDTVSIEDLIFVVSVPHDLAKYYYHYIGEDFKFSDLSTWNGSGLLTTEGWSGRFTSLVGLNNETHSIQVFCESRAGWAPSNPEKAIEITKNQTEGQIRFNVIGDRINLDKALDYTMGLIPGPVRERPNTSDLQGTRIFVRGTMEEELQPNHALRYSSIVIPTSNEDFPAEGNVEIRFRVDWDTERPDVPYINLFECNWKYDQRRLYVRWNTSNNEFEVLGLDSNNKPITVFKVPARLQNGKWYDLAFNWSRNAEIWLDGRMLASSPFAGILPTWDRSAKHIIGGSGRITLDGWRISQGKRGAGEMVRDGNWRGDESTLHLEDLSTNPTGMNITMPLIGGISNPAYLNGNWSYDANRRILVAGDDIPLMSKIEHYAKVFGARGLMLFYWSKGITGMDGFHNVEEFREGCALARANGIRVLPYTPNGINANAPEYSDYAWEFSAEHPMAQPQSWWVRRGDRLFGGVNVGAHVKRDLYWMNQLMQNGAGGIYSDGGLYFLAISNPLLNFGTTDPLSGDIIPTSNLFAVREKWKNATRLIQSYDSNAILDGHSSLGFPMPTMSHFTDATNGESLGVRENWEPYANLGPYSVEFVGRPYGFNADALFYHGAPDIEYGVALALLHGTTPRPTDWGLRPERAQKIWQVADAFDTETAEWIPYSQPTKSAFHAADSQVLVSSFVHFEDRALVFVVNWSDEAVSGDLQIDFEKLGLSPRSAIHILDTGATLEANGGKINLPLEPRRVLCLWIGDQEDIL